jgi:hypothetical protein
MINIGRKWPQGPLPLILLDKDPSPNTLPPLDQSLTYLILLPNFGLL